VTGYGGGTLLVDVRSIGEANRPAALRFDEFCDELSQIFNTFYDCEGSSRESRARPWRVRHRKDRPCLMRPRGVIQWVGIQNPRPGARKDSGNDKVGSNYGVAGIASAIVVVSPVPERIAAVAMALMVLFLAGAAFTFFLAIPIAKSAFAEDQDVHRSTGSRQKISAAEPSQSEPLHRR
jgi:hypothetical protein